MEPNSHLNIESQPMGQTFQFYSGEVTATKAEDIKGHEIAVYTLNPDKTGIWILDKIINWFRKTFGARTVVKLDLSSMGGPNKVYVRIDDLSKHFIGSKDALRAGLKSDFLEEQKNLSGLKVQLEAQTYAQLKGVNPQAIIGQIKGEGLPTLKVKIDHLAGEAQKLAEVVQKAANEAKFQVKGKKDKTATSKPVETPQAAAARQAEEVKAAKAQAEVKAARAKTEEEAKQAILKLDRYKDLYSMDFKLQGIQILGEKVGFSTLYEILQKEKSPEAKTAMLSTFEEIAHFARFGDTRYQEAKMDGEKVKMHGFAIKDKFIVIIPGKSMDSSKSEPPETLSRSDIICLNEPATSYSMEVFHFKSELQQRYLAGLKFGLKPKTATLRQDANTLQQVLQKKEEGSSLIVPIRGYLTHGLAYVDFFPTSETIDLKKASARQQLDALKDAAKGLAYLHEKGFVHMNVTPNALFFEKKATNQTAKCRIGNVGLAVQKGKKGKMYPKAYGAPECVTRPLAAFGIVPGRFGELAALTDIAKVKPKMDAFSLGVTIFEIVNGSLPDQPHFFSQLTQGSIDANINNAKANIQNDASLSTSDKQLKIQMLDVAQHLMQRKTKNRITCEEAAEQLEALMAK